MQASQIAIVEVTQWGIDKGLFVDGHFIFSADPSEGDSWEAVEEVAEALAVAAGIKITRVDHGAGDEEWQWGDIESCLKRRGVLQSIAVSEEG